MKDIFGCNFLEVLLGCSKLFEGGVEVFGFTVLVIF